jgi:hypothetical protein
MGIPEPPKSVLENRSLTMSAIIEMAKNHIELNMSDIVDIDMLEMHIKEFLETCLHDKFDTNNTITHGDTEIVVTRSNGTEDNTIKIKHGSAYITMYRYGRGNVFTVANGYWKAFRGSFRSAFMDEDYVDTVIYHLVMVLVENHFLYLV